MELKTGIVINLRNRIWRVDRVAEKEFTVTPLDGRDTRRWRFLRSLEEPHVRPGQIPPLQPGILSDPAQQNLLLRAFRLGLLHGSAPFLGLQRSRAIPEAYQLVPLLMGLNMSPIRLLIGDDVGIGKTIEAGLIISELFARGEAERLLVVVPASLREQWKESLDHFFHLDAVIMAGHTRPALERRLLPGQSPWNAYPIVISSIDYLKKRTHEVLSHKWDIVLVDEAHMAARPHEDSRMGMVQKERWDFLSEVGVSKNIKHLLLLTATPHPGFSDCFASLLEVLSPDTVQDGKIQRQFAQRHIVQRRRKDIREWYGDSKRFPERDHHDEIIPLTNPEKKLLNNLRNYISSLHRLEGHIVAQWVGMHLQRRALSSPYAIIKSLDERFKASRRRLRKSIEGSDDTAENEAQSVVFDFESTTDLDDERRYRRVDISGLLGTEKEMSDIEELKNLAKKVTRRQDGKLNHLIRILPGILSQHPKAPRTLIFTRYKDTLDYLKKQLDAVSQSDSALHGINVFTIHGDMSQTERRRIFREFEKTEKAICVATDCISEGLDLQRACAELIHYELPWNPNRLEQRNGRIDRYGQPEESVGIWTLVREDELDIMVLEVLVKKAARIRQDHGFCPVFFSSPIELKRLMRKFQPTLFDLYEEELPGTSFDPIDEDKLKRIEEECFYGQENVRLPRVEEALRKTYDTVGHPEEIRGFVQSALALYNASLTPVDKDIFQMDLRGSQLSEFDEELQITFSPYLALSDPSLVLLDLAHPLVRKLIEMVRQSAAGNQKGRVSVVGSTAVKQATAIIQVLARFITASDPPVLMEELMPIAYSVYENDPVSEDPHELLRMKPSNLGWSKQELSEYATAALNHNSLSKYIDLAVKKKQRSLLERQKDMAQIGSSWAQGMEKVEVASIDIITLTVLIPHHG